MFPVIRRGERDALNQINRVHDAHGGGFAGLINVRLACQVPP